LYYNS
jgi:hypothetical protein